MAVMTLPRRRTPNPHALDLTPDEYRRALAQDLLAEAEDARDPDCDPPYLTDDGALIIYVPRGGLSG